MRRIVEYVAVDADNLRDLNRTVNDMIQDGFEPFGSIATTNNENILHFAQAMVKHKGALDEMAKDAALAG